MSVLLTKRIHSKGDKIDEEEPLQAQRAKTDDGGGHFFFESPIRFTLTLARPHCRIVFSFFFFGGGGLFPDELFSSTIYGLPEPWKQQNCHMCRGLMYYFFPFKTFMLSADGDRWHFITYCDCCPGRWIFSHQPFTDCYANPTSN